MIFDLAKYLESHYDVISSRSFYRVLLLFSLHLIGRTCSKFQYILQYFLVDFLITVIFKMCINAVVIALFSLPVLLASYLGPLFSPREKSGPGYEATLLCAYKWPTDEVGDFKSGSSC